MHREGSFHQLCLASARTRPGTGLCQTGTETAGWWHCAGRLQRRGEKGVSIPVWARDRGGGGNKNSSRLMPCSQMSLTNAHTPPEPCFQALKPPVCQGPPLPGPGRKALRVHPREASPPPSAQHGHGTGMGKLVLRMVGDAGHSPQEIRNPASLVQD